MQPVRNSAGIGWVAVAVVLVCGVTVAACASGKASSISAANASDAPKAGDPQPEEQSCWRDQDCVLVDDCCGCARGGLRLSVRADKLDAVTGRGENACADRTCTEQPSQHRSCKATAAHCVGGSCLPAL